MGGSLVGQLGFGHAEEPLRQREQMPQNCPFKEGVGNQGYLAPHPLPWLVKSCSWGFDPPIFLVYPRHGSEALWPIDAGAGNTKPLMCMENELEPVFSPGIILSIQNMLIILSWWEWMIISSYSELSDRTLVIPLRGQAGSSLSLGRLCHLREVRVGWYLNSFCSQCSTLICVTKNFELGGGKMPIHQTSNSLK